MTDMVHGAAQARTGEAIVPEWWRTVDRWSLAAIVGLFLAGALLGLAASPPLAVRNGLEPFHYVWRQAAFAVVALAVLLAVSMMSPLRLRRCGVVAFGLSVVALALLPGVPGRTGRTTAVEAGARADTLPNRAPSD